MPVVIPKGAYLLPDGNYAIERMVIAGGRKVTITMARKAEPDL